MIVKRRDLDHDAGAEHDLRRALRRHIGRVRDRERGAAVGRLIGKNQHLAQKALRERRHQRRRRHHILQRDALEPMETRGFIGELAGRQIGEFPQLDMTAIGSDLAGGIVTAVDTSSNVCLDADIPRTARTGRWPFVFPFAPFFRIGRRIADHRPRSLAGNRTVIDPKYDTCTKRATYKPFKTNLVNDIHRQSQRGVS